MAVKLQDQKIQTALGILYKQLPDCGFIYFPLRELVKGNIKGCVWVDRWPDFKAIVITPAQWSDEDGPDPLNNVYFYGKDDADIKCLCEDPKVIEPGVPEISFWAMPLNLWNRLKESLVQGSRPVFPGHTLLENGVHTYQLTNVTYNGSLPDGFTERELLSADSEWLQKYWLPIPNVENYISECIRVTGVSVCVMNQKKEPVAWSLRHIYGAIGATFVLPEYRNLGLGKYVTTVVARKVIQIDGFCLACIELDNEKSMKLHESLGFRKCKQDVFCILSSTGSTIAKMQSH